MNDRTYRMTDETDGETWISPLADITEANADDAYVLDAVNAISIGETVRLGGGAQPTMRVERVS